MIDAPPQLRAKRSVEPPPEGPRRSAAVSLRTRILGGYLIMLVLFGVVLGTVLVQMAETSRNLVTLSGGYLPLTEEVARLSSLPLGMELEGEGAAERAWRVRRSELVYIGRMDTQLRRARTIVAELLERDLPPQDSASLRSVDAQLKLLLKLLLNYGEVHATFLTAVESGDGEPAALLPELVALRRQLDINLRTLNNRLSRRVADVADRTGAAQAEARVAVAALSGVAFGVALLLLFATQVALRPIRRLTRVADRIREGHLDEPVPATGGDEVGHLARAMGAMATALQEREARIEERSEALERALQELNASRDRQIRAERLAAVGQMAAQIAHEVRNPLNALGLNADLLNDEIHDGDPAEASDLLAAIRKEIERLTAITEGWLSLAAQPNLQLGPQDLPALVDELLRFQGEELQRGGVGLEWTRPEGLKPVNADPGQLRQALLNILRNAFDALREAGGGTIGVEVASVEGGGVVVIRDDGPGMDAEHVARIFDPFFSTKEEGSGLGLPLTHQIITEHGGRIACHSALNEGTEFRIWLPEA